MTCCAPGVESAADMATAPESDDETLLSASHELKNGNRQLELAVPDINCAACIKTIETALESIAMVENARVNFSTKRVRIAFDPKKGRPSDLTKAIVAKGYRTFLLDPDLDGGKDKNLANLVRALAVAGFAAANIMLFSVSIWSGAEPVTRDLFHWISALIAVPAVAYAGQPFFRSAIRALRHGALNMDVPISLAVILALGLSLFETFNHGAHAYFDAAVSLLFFLLIGRTLDHLMREKARGAVRNLARLAPRSATRIHPDGQREQISVTEILPGMLLEIAPGERIPVDATIVSGTSEVDLSLVTGESVPEQVEVENQLLAGTTNLSGSLTIRATKPATSSFLARMISLMEAAEGSKAGYKRIADRAAAIYAPAVHILALGTFLGWGFITGNWHVATLNAVAVLIITCPCALALAVPIVHVVASGRLFEHGIMMRDGAALERLAEITRVAFDKTGTLTNGRPVFISQIFGDPELLQRAGALALSSRHPFSKALVTVTKSQSPFENAREVPGFGVEVTTKNGVWRLGRATFCHAKDGLISSNASTVWLSHDENPVAAFTFADQMRPEVKQIVAELETKGMNLSLLSGDRELAGKGLASFIGIKDARFDLTPEQKLEALNNFAAKGDKVLMVGDGLNDAPSLRAAHVSMAPSSAADIGRSAADFIYTRNSLDAVPFTLNLAQRAAWAVKQNFALALAYNCVAVPLAVSGQVTPLIAALAMSSSSILVTLNALRLRLGKLSTPPKSSTTDAGVDPHKTLLAQ